MDLLDEYMVLRNLIDANENIRRRKNSQLCIPRYDWLNNESSLRPKRSAIFTIVLQRDRWNMTSVSCLQFEQWAPRMRDLTSQEHELDRPDSCTRKFS